MTKRSIAMLIGGLFLAGGVGFWAVEMPGPYGPGGIMGPLGSPVLPERQSPKVQIDEFIGTIESVDTISGKIFARDASGNRMEFPVDTNTPVLDRNLRITLKDLHLGQQLSIIYSARPFRVHRIDRL